MFSPSSVVKQSLLDESTSLVSTDNTPEQTFDDIETSIERTKVEHRFLDPDPTNHYYYPQNYTENTAFRNITNIEPSKSFSRLNADRLRTIAASHELACENNLIAPKSVLANALADHIYKVTNQKPSTSRIDEIITNKIINKNVDYTQKENQWDWNETNDIKPFDNQNTNNELYNCNNFYSMYNNS